ncbi:MAG: hypothetical protein WC091_23075, partial [Sulfuricellaceae bacterium]
CFSFGDKAHSRHLAFCLCQETSQPTLFLIRSPFAHSAKLRAGQTQGERIKNNVGITSAYVRGTGSNFPVRGEAQSNHERGSLTLSVSDADIVQPTKQTSASAVSSKPNMSQKLLSILKKIGF